MKLSILAVAVMLSTSMMAQSAQADSSKVFHTSGAFAQMWSPTPIPSGSVWLYASHTDRPQVSTFVEFNIFILNPDGSSTSTFGFGTVPEDDLTGNVKKNLTLHVNTSPSSFQTTTCRSDGTCEPGPFGLIQLDFSADGDFTARNISENRYEFVQLTQRGHYDSAYASALASGSILGNSVNNGTSSIGTNRGTTIILTRKR